jgi:hypothetical protein
MILCRRRGGDLVRPQDAIDVEDLVNRVERGLGEQGSRHGGWVAWVS